MVLSSVIEVDSQHTGEVPALQIQPVSIEECFLHASVIVPPIIAALFQCCFPSLQGGL